MAKRQYWYFTWGSNHTHSGYYTRIYGTYESARDEMIEMFGHCWAFQHTGPESAGIRERNLKEIH